MVCKSPDPTHANFVQNTHHGQLNNVKITVMFAMNKMHEKTIPRSMLKTLISQGKIIFKGNPGNLTNIPGETIQIKQSGHYHCIHHEICTVSHLFEGITIPLLVQNL